MALESMDDLLAALRDHPEWRDGLRRVLLTEALLGLPDQVSELAEAQARTEARLEQLVAGVSDLAEAQARTEARLEQLAEAQARTEARLEQLAEAQARTEARLEQLVAGVSDLAEAQARTEARLEQLAEAQARTEARLEALIEQVSSMAGHVDWLKGAVLEMRYRDRATAYFGRIARRLHVLTSDEVEDLLAEATDAGQLTEEEAQEIRLSDGLMRGRREGDEIFLVVEVSWGVGMDDMTRAQDRAGLLAKTGRSVLPVVAGTWVNPDVNSAAPQAGVWQVSNGAVVPPGGHAA